MRLRDILRCHPVRKPSRIEDLYTIIIDGYTDKSIKDLPLPMVKALYVVDGHDIPVMGVKLRKLIGIILP
jgi:23S rRNA C2498 (ribose-2'-O)-methylase RlmM